MRIFGRSSRRTISLPATGALLLLAAAVVPAVCRAAGDDLAELEQRAFRAAVDRVSPSVVQIETIGGLERSGEILLGTGPTTGLIVTPDGYIVSSAFHFAGHPGSILVQVPGGGRKPARLVATDHNRMFVLLKIDPDKPLPVPETAPVAGLRVGQWTVGVGRTFESGSCNMSVGVISALNRIWGKALQTDAAVSPNNYGGPLIDIHGRVIGILVPLSPQESSEVAGYEWYDSGIGFALPAETVWRLLPRLKQGNDLHPGVMGIQLPMQTLIVAEPVLTGSRPRSPAYRAGLRRNDRIVEIDGAATPLAAQIKEQLSRRYAGDTVKVVAMRGDKRIEAQVALVAALDPFQPPFLGILPARGSADSPAVGDAAKVAPAADKPASEPAKPTTKPAKPAAAPDRRGEQVGVAVRYVFAAGPAAKAGLLPGDRIVRASGESLRDTKSLRQILAERESGEKLELDVIRSGQSRKCEVALAPLPESMPPADIPAAAAPSVAVKPTPEKTPEVGVVHLKVPGLTQDVWAYVPQQYRADMPCGMVVWLAGAEAFDEAALAARWKPLCDRYGLILAALRAAEPGRWTPGEGQQIPRVVAQAATHYRVDPSRVAVVGRRQGGVLALESVFRYSGVLRAAVAVDAAMPTSLSVREPPMGLAFLLATSGPSPVASAVKETAARLRKWQYPVTSLDLGPGDQPRDLTAEELSEVARWIDALDRL